MKVNGQPNIQAADNTRTVKPNVPPKAVEQKNESKPINDNVKITTSNEAKATASIPLIEADMNIKMSGRTNINGQVTLQHAMIFNTLQDSLKNQDAIANPNLTYDKNKGAYTISGNYKMNKLIHPAFKIGITPELANDKFSLKVTTMDYPGPDVKMVSNFILKKAADNINGTFAGTKYDKTQKAINIPVDSLLSKMPFSVQIDYSKTSLSSSKDKDGNITINFKSNDVAPKKSPDTPQSDISFMLDKTGATNLFKEALGQDLLVQSVDFSDNLMTINTKAEVPELTDTLIVVGLLGVLAGNSFPDDVRGRIDLKLDVSAQDGKISIKPSISKAIDPIVEKLKSSDVKCEVKNKAIIIDLNEMFKTTKLKDSQIHDISITPEGFRIDTSLDLDKAVK